MPDYISAFEAAKKWDISLRQVQRLLAQGRVDGARKFERSWLVPANAKKPTNRLGKERQLDQIIKDDLAVIIAATDGLMPRHDPRKILDSLSAARLRWQFEAELSYLSGDFCQAMEIFAKTQADDAARLRSCTIAVAAAISLGDYERYRQIESYLEEIAAGSGFAASLAQLSLATVAVSVIAPNMVPDWLKEGDFDALPPQLLPNAFYLRSKYFFCIGDFEAMLLTAQATLALSSKPDGFTMTDLYLRLSCAVACHYLGKSKEAKDHLLKALDLTLPHGLITPIAEQMSALGGLVEKCLKQEYPSSYDAVLEQWQCTWKNWVHFHNRFTRDNITLILTLREYHIAAQVARHVPYAKIAEEEGISVGRLKNIMQIVYEKLFISGRSELSKLVY